MRYIAIHQIQGSKEIIGIVQLPDDIYARRVYRHPDTAPLTSKEITESEYSTYKAFELVPVFSWVPVKDQEHQHADQQADIYDPEFFFADDEDIYKRDLPTEHPQCLVKG